MIKLSKMTDYAIVILSQLTQETSGVLSAADLSLRTAIPEPTVSKVLKKLSKTDFVHSFRGVSGGYKISDQGKAASIADIIRHMDGPIAIVDCVEVPDTNGCSCGSRCPINGSFDKINAAIESALDSVKLTELVRESCPTRKTG